MSNNNLSMIEYFCAKSVENKAINLLLRSIDILKITDNLIFRESEFGGLFYNSIIDLI
jgi:hypothetical protein